MASCVDVGAHGVGARLIVKHVGLFSSAAT
jgi:hypothetical protein